MSNWDEYDDSNDDGNTPRGLRSQLEKALADKKAAEDRAAQAEAKLNERVGVDALKDKVANPAKVASIAVKDGVDLSDQSAVEKWLSENDGLFAPASKSDQSDDSGAGDGDQDADQTPTSAIPAGMENAFGAMNRIHAAASPAMVNKYEAAMAGIPADASEQQVLEAMRAAGL